MINNINLFLNIYFTSMKSFNNHINEALITKQTKLVSKNFKPKTLTELRNIINDRLKQDLTVLDLSDIDVSQVEDFSYLFYHLTNVNPKITTIRLNNWDTSSVTDMSFMFADCINIKEIIGIEYLNVENVKSFQYMFQYCKSLSSLNLSLWKTLNATDLTGMFYKCLKLKRIIGIESFNTIQVESASNMFSCCNKLEEINLNNWKTDNLQYTIGMFSGCRHLKKVSIGNINTKLLGYCTNMFQSCTSLETIDDLSNWIINYNAQNFNSMFQDCISLVRIKGIDTWFNKGVYFKQKIDLEFMFKNCINLKDLGNLEKWKNNYYSLNTKDMFENTNLGENIPSWYFQNQ